MKCSECGGQVVAIQHAVYRSDGSTSGTYDCRDCKRVKSWFHQGTGETVIYMKEETHKQSDDWAVCECEQEPGECICCKRRMVDDDFIARNDLNDS